MRDTAPFISSIARREITRTLQIQRRILWIQMCLLIVQSAIIVILVIK